MRRVISVFINLAMVGLAAGCSKASEPAAAAASTPGTASSATMAAKKAEPTACTLVTSAEMSTIVGSAVTGAADDGGGSTTCKYTPAAGRFPIVEFKVDWGSASAAMMATGIMNGIEPGITNPLAGLGDKAAQIGPQLWVQVGEDLVTITMMGVDDHVAAAKRIVDTARPRMPKTS